ncbi:MAG: FG-GAP repeat domain-containing protein [Isosphaeraceae bacterium]
MTKFHRQDGRHRGILGASPRGQGRSRNPRAGRCLVIEELECRRCPSVAPGLAAAAINLPLDPNTTIGGQLQGVGTSELYHVSVDANGLLAAQVDPLGFDTRLSLLDGQGELLIESEASSTADPDDRVAMHVTPGDYFLMVQSQSGSGSFTMATSFTRATTPSQPLSADNGSYSVAVADLNGDKIPDLVIADFYDDVIEVALGNGDGTFQPPVTKSVGLSPAFVTTADLTGNGIQDIITADTSSNDVSILLGNGDGTFQAPIEIPAGLGPSSVAVGDFTGNGRLDLAVTDSIGNDVQILLGNGDGTFSQGPSIPTGPDPSSVVAGEFTGDGRTDLAVTTIGGSDLTIFQGQGNGTFTQVQQLPTGPSPTSVIAADFNGDGIPDLAVACAGDNTVRVFLDRGGVFTPSAILQASTIPYSLAAADFNGDGHLDLAVSSYGAGDVSIFFGNGNGTFQPQEQIPVGASMTGIVAADLTGDGRADLVAADVVSGTVDVLLGNGDGTFQTPAQPTLPSSSPDVVAADLTGNGIEDLIVPNLSSDDLSILLGRGDGCFRAPILVPVGLGPWGVAVGDFTGNGIPDLAVTNRIGDTVSILLGNGDGTFRPAQTLLAGIQPSYIVAADLNGNGHLDLVESNYISDTISIFYGNGNGKFQPQVTLPVGSVPGNPVVADFNGDGRPDIAIADDQYLVTVYLATGPETFAPPEEIPAGPGVNLLAVGDLNGDGIPDLVAADTGSGRPSYITILMGNGDGTFRAGQTVQVGDTPYPVTLADLNGDGKLDIITGNLDSNTISVLMGHGDGTFLPEVEYPAGTEPFALAVADFSGDGLPDIAVADYHTGDISLLMNLGGGMFGPPVQMPTAASQIATVTADFNDNGRLDLAVANPLNDTVTIMLGNGDGTYTTGQTIAVGVDPSGLVAADFNHDGQVDLAVACAGSNEVMVLLGLGDGTFCSPIVLPVGESPQSIVVGDFLDNGITDIAVADVNSDDVAILLGQGDGTFLPARRYPVGNEPVALLAADLNGDGFTDLVTANRTSGDLTVLWNLAGQGFQSQTYQYGGHAPTALAVFDGNGDGRFDLAVADEDDESVSVLMNLGGGAFAPAVTYDIGQAVNDLDAATLDGGTGISLVAASANSQDVLVLSLGSGGTLVTTETIALGSYPYGLVLGDFNGDGIVDLAIPTSSGDQIVVRLGTTGGPFLAPEDIAPVPQAAPVVVDWNDDRTPDVFELDQQGQLLLRLGQPGSRGQFEAPQIIGQSLGVRFSDIALVATRYGPALAALEQEQPVVWLFSVGQGPGASIEAQSIPVPGASLLVSITAGDLDNDGLDDLVLVDRGNDQLIVLYQNPNGTFGEEGPRLDVGYAPSSVAIADLNSDGWPDLVVSNTYSGDLSVFYGGPGRRFSPDVLLPAGLGASVVVSQNGSLVPHTDDEPIGVTTGVFDASGLTDVVSVQSGADRISLLDGTPDGGLANPSLATSDSTGEDPTQVVAGPLTKDGLTDLVVLNQGSQDISIFLNNGKGGFIAMPTVDAGNDSTGIAVRDINGDGIPDLLVSSGQGDLLIIIGNGNGTFQPYQRADQSVSLAVGDFNSDGQPEFVLSNTSIDQLSIEYGDTQSFVQGRSQGLQAPGEVAVADLNGDGNLDIIVVNQGENDILVYLGLGGNQFEAPLIFYTGTDPVGLTVADLNGTGVPDLIVANAGSNDLSIFIGVGQGANWELEPRPRLPVGDDPISTTVADVYGDGIPDIICVDQGSDDVVVLRGLGDGFFEDDNPLTLPAGPAPIRAFVGTFEADPELDLVILDAGSDELTFYPDFLRRRTPEFIPTGGADPITAVMGTIGDGYDVLYIAHEGETSISVLEGGPAGLVLADPVSLGSSAQPNALAIVPDGSGSLRLYVSAAGKDGVILVTITLGDGSDTAPPGVSALPAPAPTQGAVSRVSSLSTEGSPFSVETVPTGFSAQVQASAQIDTVTVAPVSVAAPAAISWGSVPSTLQPIIAPSMTPLAFLVNTLVPTRYVQISDIMPLDNSAIETVAVLLVVPEASAATTINAHPPSLDEPMSEAVLAVRDLRAEERGNVRRSSNLERFLSDLDGALHDAPRDVLATIDESNGTSSRGVRRPGDLEMAAITVSRQGEPEVAGASIPPDPRHELAPTTEPSMGVTVPVLQALGEQRSQSVPSNIDRPVPLGWARVFIGMLAISSTVIVWKATRKWRTNRRAGEDVLKDQVMHGPHLKASSRVFRRARPLPRPQTSVREAPGGMKARERPGRQRLS